MAAVRKQIAEPPPELQCLTPRKLRLNGTGASRLAWAFVALVIAGWFFTSYATKAAHESRVRNALRASGQQVDGELLGVTFGQDQESATVGYAFELNGKKFSGSAYAPEFFANELKLARSIPVRYLPSDPAINHPADWEWSPVDDIWELIASAPFAAWGLYILVGLLRSFHVVSEGAPALATVIDCYDRGRRRGYRVEYEFHLGDGRKFTGRYTSNELPDVGAEVWVLYLQEDPRRNLPDANSSFSVVM